MFKKMKSYSFWVSLAGAVIIFANCIAKVFDFSFDSEIMEEVILAFAGILVVLGVVSKDGDSGDSENSSDETETSKQDE